MKANFKNSQTGAVKQVKVGFSWTVFFFGFFPPLFRGDFKWGAIIAVIQFALAFLYPAASFVVSVVLAFMYNKLYVKEIMAKGFEPVSDADRDILNSKNYLS